MLKPVNEWVIVEAIKQEEKTESGLYMPKEVLKKDNIRRSTVLQMAEKFEEDVPFKVGDVILHHDQTGVPFNLDGVELLWVKPDAVMGVIPAGEKDV